MVMEKKEMEKKEMVFALLELNEILFDFLLLVVTNPVHQR